MSKPELYYFSHVKGLGSQIKLALRLAKVDYKDTEYEFAAMKKMAGTEECPFGQQPVFKTEKGFFFFFFSKLLKVT